MSSEDMEDFCGQDVYVIISYDTHNFIPELNELDNTRSVLINSASVTGLNCDVNTNSQKCKST